MPDLSSTARKMRERLDKKESAREEAIKLSRKIIRECRSSIAAIQGGRDPEESMDLAKKMHSQLNKVLSAYPDLQASGYTVDAEQELAEVEILTAAIADIDPPTPEKIGVTDEAFVLGLGDSIGELRRVFLHRLMKDDVSGAESMLKKMENFFSILMTFDYPDALIATKRKQDVARSLVEKCRGELILSAQMSQLRKDLND
jgi:translin